jgi:hypothetical protein
MLIYIVEYCNVMLIYIVEYCNVMVLRMN